MCRRRDGLLPGGLRSAHHHFAGSSPGHVHSGLPAHRCALPRKALPRSPPFGPRRLAENRPRGSALRQPPKGKAAPRPLDLAIPPRASVSQTAPPSNRLHHSAGSLPNVVLAGTRPAPLFRMPGPRSGNRQRGAGRALRGLGLGSSLPRPPPEVWGQEQVPVRTPPWPAARPHPNTCSELQIFIAAGRRPQGAGSRLGLRAPDSVRPTPPSRRVGAGRGRGARAVGGTGTRALLHLSLACHLATRVVAAKNRDAGLSCPRGWGICAAARRCAESTSCKCRDGGEGLILIVQVVQILPQLFPVGLFSTVGKYKEKQNLLSAPQKLSTE